MRQNYNITVHELCVTQMTILLQYRVKALTASKGYNHGLTTIVRDARHYLVNSFTYFLKKECRGPNIFEAFARNYCVAGSDRRTK